MRNMALFIFCAICSHACNTATTAGENQNAPQIQIVEKYFESFNAHQWDKMTSLYADTVDIKDPAYGMNLRMTKADILKKYTELHQTIPDVHDSIVNMYSSDKGYITVEFISTGTAPDQSKFALPICTIFRIENGFITKDFTYYDNF